MHHGASILHGCDNSADTIRHANELFADYRHAQHKFEVVDLTGGAAAVDKAFPNRQVPGGITPEKYDMVLMLAVYHKLRRVMELKDLLTLVGYFAHRCGKFFVWRGSREELGEFEPTVIAEGFRRVHYSEICEIELPEYTETVAQPAAIWARVDPRGTL